MSILSIMAPRENALFRTFRMNMLLPPTGLEWQETLVLPW